MKLRNILFLTLSLLLAACTSETLAPTGVESGFVLSLRESVLTQSRTTPDALAVPLQEQFRITVQNQRTGNVAYDGAFQTEVPAGIGVYDITATYGRDVELGVDAPYYRGQTTGEIKEGDLTPTVSISCSVANALLSFRLLDSDGKPGIDAYFSDYCLRVAVGNLSVDLKNPARSAYFRAGTTPTVQFIGTLLGTNRTVTYDIEHENLHAIAAGQNVILNLKMQQTNSGVILDVVKADVETVTIPETIPLDWLPAPKVTMTANDMLIYETEENVTAVAALLTTSSVLQDMELTLSLEDPALSALNKTYLLSSITEEECTALAAAGITLPELGSSYSASNMDFGTFSQKLRSNDGMLTNNRVSLRLKANNRWSTVATTDFRVVKPVITLPGQAMGNAWSKSLYIDALTTDNIVGNGISASEVLQRVVYETTSDGVNWIEAKTSADQGKLYTTGLTAGHPYQLRARIKGTQIFSGTNNFTTEAEQPVPNGDFEELSETIAIEDMDMGGQYKIWPVNYQNRISFTISEPKGWATINSTTCNYSGASNKNSWFVVPSTFNTNCSAQVYQSFGVGGNGTTHTKADLYADRTAQAGACAMVLQNVAWSLNGTTPSRSGGAFNTTYYCENAPSSISNRSAGELFLKDEQGEGSNELTTRPTHLQFFYKYENQKDNNEFGFVQIELLNGNTQVATSTAKLSAASDFKQATVEIGYNRIDMKIDRLRIKFKSSDATTVTTENVTSWYQCSYGAQLTIDNLTFTYDK